MTEQSRTEKPARSVLLVLLVMLIALVGAGISGYLLFIQQFHNPTSQIQLEFSALDKRLSLQEKQLARQLTETAKRLAELIDKNKEVVADLNREMASVLNKQKNQAAPTSREWILAEVEYLLRIANHRLLLERDAKGALQLLQAADEELRQLDDFSLYPVRTQLADEILLMKRLKGVDIQGVFLQLQALKKNINKLPLRLPEYVAESARPARGDENGDLWNQLLVRLKNVFEFRHYTDDGATDNGIRPLLSPDQAGYLELNMRLMFERAQLALLRQNNMLFQQSIGDILGWLKTYMNLGNPVANQMHIVLQQLAKTNIEKTLPDISGSLNALIKLRRHAQSSDRDPAE